MLNEEEQCKIVKVYENLVCGGAQCWILKLAKEAKCSFRSARRAIELFNVPSVASRLQPML